MNKVILLNQKCLLKNILVGLDSDSEFDRAMLKIG